MNKFNTYPFIIAFFALALIFACKKDQPDMRQAEDPCACASEVTAEFVIEERATHIPEEIWIETDTTLHDKTVGFRALEEDAEYTWYIGAQQFNTQTASRFFTDEWIGYDIPITLVVKKEPNKACFPDDDGYDSITKTFHVSQYPIRHGFQQDIEHGGIEGTYRVIGNGLADSIEVTINFRDLWGVRTTEIGNPDGSGVYCNHNDTVKAVNHWTYRTVDVKWYSDEDLCLSVGVNIHNRLDGVSVLNFKRAIPTSGAEFEMIEWQYKGRKIN